MAERKLHRARVDVRPRFRCLICRRFVHGTEHGTCPQCGWEPPQMAPLRPPRARVARSPLVLVLLVLAFCMLVRWIGPGG